MEGLVIFYSYLGIIGLGWVMGRVFPLLLVLTCHLIGEALSLLLSGLLLALAYATRGGREAFVFAYFLFDEFRREAEEAPYPDDDKQDADDGQDAARFDPLADPQSAASLLGLSLSFTQAELKSAYRRTMKSAHPDVAGGSTQAAQQVNAAYTLLMQARGWA